MDGKFTLRTTYFGRNTRAIKYMQKQRKGKATVAWVVGIGGGRRRTPLEHLEVGLALRQLEDDFHVHAIDIHPIPIQTAQKNLEKGHAPFFPEDEASTPDRRLRDYARRVLGVTLTPQGFHIPQDMIGRITLHGPHAFPEETPTTAKNKSKKGGQNNPGNVFAVLPSQRPDVITCFNLSDKYQGKDQGAQLADNLADALNEGGIILTDHSDEYRRAKWGSPNASFVDRLREKLGKPKEMPHTEIPEYISPVRILVFTKAKTSPR